MSSGRILVVDDAPRNLTLLADLLVAEGYDVRTATSGTEALAAIASAPPELVLLDAVMPGLDGFAVCRAIRAEPATALLPVVIVTALEGPSERIKGLDAGADDFLSKPINPPELLARVRSLLRAKRLYDTVQEQAAQLADWSGTLERRVREQVDEIERLGRLKRFLPPQVVAHVASERGRDALESRRREIVAVSVELRGFPAFAESAAPEDVMRVLQEFHHAIGELVVAFEGTIERFTGDGLTVLFNDPLPQADAPTRAVRMALALRDRSRALAAAWEQDGFRLHVGVGIAQGYATLGAIGFEARADYMAIGTVATLAARLGEVAEAGEILLSPRVRPAAESGIRCTPAGDRTLRGFARPVTVARAEEASAPRPDATVGGGRVLRRDGDYWTVAFGREAFRLRDAKGLHHIARLLAHPEQELYALDLVVAASESDGDVPPAGPAADAGPLLDATAKHAYRERIADLRQALAEAEACGDLGRSAGLREELEQLTQQLAAAVGLGGRDRRAAAAAERARVNVTRAISDSIRRIREFSPALARYLEASIRTGTFCAYRPPDADAARWEL